jgi:haloalkane dehalogenase
MPHLRSPFCPSPQLYPFTSRWLSTSAGEVHYLDEGTGPVVLLVHGNPTWSFSYRKLITELVSRDYRCIAPDLMGYGLSDHPSDFSYRAVDQAGLVVSLIERLDLDGLIVVGQDWGGPIGLGAAVNVHARIRGVVLGSTFAWRSAGLVRFIARILRSTLLQRTIVDGDKFIAFVVRHLATAHLSAEELAHYAGVATTPALRRAKAILPRELIDADDWLEQLERDVAVRLGDKPALLIDPAGDGLLGRRACRRFQGLFADSLTLRLPRARHFFQEDAPVEVARAIAARFV